MPDWRLVLAGMRGYHARPVERLVEELGLGECVRITGWVPRDELYALFRGAWAFVYPSTFEGFGMPVLEALAAGIPTCCSDIPPLREVAADAVVFFDPSSDDDLLRAMTEVTSDTELRARLAHRGREHAADFSWAACAKTTLDVIEEAAGGGG
jgi:glycosyltransferase involved in cell wall biosynthesis